MYSVSKKWQQLKGKRVVVPFFETLFTTVLLINFNSKFNPQICANSFKLSSNINLSTIVHEEILLNYKYPGIFLVSFLIDIEVTTDEWLDEDIYGKYFTLIAATFAKWKKNTHHMRPRKISASVFNLTDDDFDPPFPLSVLSLIPLAWLLPIWNCACVILTHLFTDEPLWWVLICRCNLHDKQRNDAIYLYCQPTHLSLFAHYVFRTQPNGMKQYGCCWILRTPAARSDFRRE